MDPKPNRAPEPEEPETIDDDVVMIEEEPSDRDTIPPDGPLLVTESIPPDDAEIDDALLDEELGDVFSRIRSPSLPPEAPPVLDETADPEEDAFYKQFE
jgi:hypothetical protein